MKISFAQKSAAERKSIVEGLPEQFAALDDDALAAALTDVTSQANTLFALDAPTFDQVGEVEALSATKAAIQAEQTARDKAVKDAQERFAAAKATFNVNDGTEEGAEEGTEVDPDLVAETAESDEDEDEDSEEVEDSGEVEVDAAGNPFDDKRKKKTADDEEDPTKKVVTASGSRRLPSTKGNTAQRVAKRTPRPAAKASNPMVITASADIPGVAMGSRLEGLADVSKATISRVGGFPAHSPRTAAAIREANGDAEVLNKFGVASFALDFKPEMVASGNAGQEYGAMQAALKDHEAALVASISKDQTLTAAGWCSPSEIAFNWLADYVVDGLLTTPQVNAPRGGLMTTTGPALSERYEGAGLDNFGWTHTEAMSEAGAVKTCEVIDCPEFEDHRLDAVGYCWKIPILTQKAYPELITDALRLSSVLYAHKMNARFIADSLALSTLVGGANGAALGLGGSFDDTLEALTIIATKERRRWNVGENKIMEVKMPVWAREVFRAEIGRRPFRTTAGPVTDQMINAEFTARKLAPEYVSDWAELTGANPVFAANFPVMIYPAGTFVKAVEDVINLSAVYDAASLSVNEYTGVFFEQGVMLFKAGYGSTKFNIPVCTAGLVGAPVLDCSSTTPNTNGNAAA